MGIPRKKSRPIEVEGRKYRWLPKHGKGRIIGNSRCTMHLIIQIDDKRPGRILSTWLSSKNWKGDPRDPENNYYTHRAALTPKDVREVILKGLELGWDPMEKGTPFVFPEAFDLTEFVTQSGNDITINGVWGIDEVSLLNLLDADIYVDLMTAGFPAGEIRGQVMCTNCIDRF